MSRDYEYGAIRAIGPVILSILVCLGCLLCGVVLAMLSLRDPDRAALFERWSGVCLMIGLCLLGVALRGAR